MNPLRTLQDVRDAARMAPTFRFMAALTEIADEANSDGDLDALIMSTAAVFATACTLANVDAFEVVAKAWPIAASYSAPRGEVA